MKNIQDYTVIQEGNIKALTRSVKECINQGWTPQGGLVVDTVTDSPTRYAQAMVLKIDEELS